MFFLRSVNASFELGKVYVFAFPDFSEFRKHTANIAWETEVRIKESPDHKIHFYRDRFWMNRNCRTQFCKKPIHLEEKTRHHHQGNEGNVEESGEDEVKKKGKYKVMSK